MKRAGYEYIEISRKHDNLKQRLTEIREIGLKVWAVHGTMKSEAISLDADIRKYALETEFVRMQDAAAFAPCPYVIHYLDRFINTEYGKQFSDVVEQLRVKCAELGFVLAIETAPYSKYDERYADSLEIAGFVRSFHSPYVQVTVDINNSSLKEDLKQVCENCCGIIGNVHISDNRGGREQHLVPGCGHLNIRRAVEMLIAADYEGPCNLECHHINPTTEVLKMIKETTEEICKGINNGSDSM
ncbi:MAG: TIM barrel protein [Victivallaceae bacterium]